METLTRWNPGLSDAQALLVVRALFGLALPDVTERLDLECVHTPSFYQTVVAGEIRRVLAAVGDPQRVVPWVDTGRSPHDGDPMSAGELYRLLRTAEGAGLERVLYLHAGKLTAGEWSVLSALCGSPWRPVEASYQPPDRAERRER